MGRMTSLREPDAGWRDRLTVIITTSPLPRHPCSSMLEAILLSLGGFGGLAGCRTLIVADGYEASAAEGQAARWKKGKISEEAAARYEQHKQRVRLILRLLDHRAQLEQVARAEVERR